VELVLPPNLRLQSLSAADQIVAALRQLILDGTLPPRTPLREVALAEAFDVSRTTIRDAVRTLAHEGLARHERHRSAVVVDMAPEDAADIYAVRRLLELSATEHMGAMTPEELERVNGAFDRLKQLVLIGGWSEVVSADLEFHKSIISVHRSPRLLRCFEAIESELAFCLSLIRMHEHEPDNPDRIIREHDEIRAAIVSGSVAETRALLAAHFSYYEERVTDALRRRMDKDQQEQHSGDRRRGSAEGSDTAAARRQSR
jgi:DNA-binding GntR family transcriptional regulator